MSKDVINDNGDWRHKRERCYLCGQISMYRMPVHTHENRCENPDCDMNGIKQDKLEKNQIRKVKK
jgi:hypothetical protein